ncbi:M16 family metallopeptidase [Streptomyces liangshanensis]|uniref:Insulinase family protein n=1 Tax=Streptomyces liangshanensis TaxID=2717324 RepID=A0A6G9GY07_9ACTN|nr:insulinase family protein [Streptomyces liangshanensis]QIQ03158.1 insulinase family protein [Streptomyces liangshanensis]
MSQQTPAAPAAATPAQAPAAGIRLTEVDGVRTLLAAGSGPITAGLVFRVGAADETYATSGITHLVEHLALFRHGVSDLHYNGATATTYTIFHATGTADEVVTYLSGVCDALRDLPLERLETEREILRTEAAGRSYGPNHQLPLWRYGAQGYGLVSYTELGAWHLTADAVREWAATRFTRENAVLWITSDTVPEGLRLDLPSGPRHPMPPVTSALPVTPAYIGGDDGGVVMDGIVRRSTAASLFAEVLGRALYADLRQKGGYSYATAGHYSPRDADFATITAFADALPQKQDAVVGGFVDVLARLRAGRIAQAELDAARNKVLKQFDHPDAYAGSLPSYALNLLVDHPNATHAEHRAELAAVTVDDLRDVARELHSTALLQVPGRGADWAGFTEAPQYSAEDDRLTGTRHRSHDDKDTILTVAAEGIGLSTPGGMITVRYDACAAMVAYPDGGRRLTGHDGFQIAAEPTLYADLTPDRIATIDAAVPPTAVVRAPERAPERIPQPRPASEAAARRTWSGAWRRIPAPLLKLGARVSHAATLFFGLRAVTLTWTVEPRPGTAFVVLHWLLLGGSLALSQVLRKALATREAPERSRA